MPAAILVESRAQPSYSATVSYQFGTQQHAYLWGHHRPIEGFTVVVPPPDFPAVRKAATRVWYIGLLVWRQTADTASASTRIEAVECRKVHHVLTSKCGLPEVSILLWLSSVGPSHKTRVTIKTAKRHALCTSMRCRRLHKANVDRHITSY